jgi:hypothetical protein
MLFKRKPLPKTPRERAQQKLDVFINVLWACRGMIIFGFVTSAGGNVLHAVSKAAVGQPLPIRIAIALLAPILLLGAFEAISRIPLPPAGLRWHSLRYWATGLRILAMFTIATVTVVTSFRHQRSALETYGGDHLQAIMLPGAIDAFMLVGSLSVLEVMIFIRNMEEKIAAMDLSASAKEDAKVAPEKPLNGRERIAMAFMDMPWASVKDIATRAGTTEAYTATEVSKLKKTQRATNGTGQPVTAPL